MGFKIGKALGSIAGAAVGGFFGGAPGATAGAGIGNALLGGNDDEMTALQAYQMQRADALSDWERQNAYNSPEAIMQRYVKAGINPYLAVNAATGSGSSPIDNVSYNGSYAQPVSKQLQNALANLNLRAMKAETKGKEVDTEMRELDLALKRARLASLGSGKAVTSPLNSLKDQKLLAQIAEINARVEAMKNKKGWLGQQFDDLWNIGESFGSKFADWATDDYMLPVRDSRGGAIFDRRMLLGD